MINLYCWYCARLVAIKPEGIRITEDDKGLEVIEIPVEPCQACMKAEVERFKQTTYEGDWHGK